MFGMNMKARAVCVAAAVALAAAVTGAVALLHESADGVRRSTVMVECEEWGEVSIGGRPVLYYPVAVADTALTRLTMHRDSALHRRWTAGCWVDRWPLLPSCRGRVATVLLPGSAAQPGGKADVGALCRRYVSTELATLRGQTAELKYYLRVHGVQDEGYQRIAAIAQRVEADYAGCRRMKALLDSAGTKARFTAVLRRSYTVLWRDSAGHVRRTPCRVAAADKARHTLLLRTADGATPGGVRSVALLPWDTRAAGEMRMAGFGGFGVPGLECDTVGVSIVPGHLSGCNRHDIPDILAPDGSAAFTVRGVFMGLKSGDSIVGNADLRRLFGKEAGR